jgi:hypothetical protein
VSLQLDDGVLHLLGTVCRKAAGDDDRQYVGIEYDRLPDSDVDRLLTQHHLPPG